LSKMEENLESSHVEESGAPTVLQGAQVVSDVDLVKAGADDIQEDNVANVHLMSLSILHRLEKVLTDFHFRQLRWVPTNQRHGGQDIGSCTPCVPSFICARP